jgi:hypothetical protein
VTSSISAMAPGRALTASIASGGGKSSSRDDYLRALGFGVVDKI